MSRIGDMFQDWLDGGEDSSDNLDPDDTQQASDDD